MSKIQSEHAAGPPTSTTPGRELGREMATAVVLFHEAIASRLGLSATEWRCWGLLEQHGPSTAGRLAELSGFTTGAITGIVDRLERSGYARRQRHPTDRRSVIIHPLCVNKLRRRVWPIFASLSESMDKLAAHYTARELNAIHDYFRRTIQVLHAETVKLTRAPRPRNR
ncbi:MAG TPA: MarR family transcriptional regulator [Verrucomicrobiae bacterium]|nr:MarR family transcriptional regulator [Verrucomicrobiae bacterium]